MGMGLHLQSCVQDHEKEDRALGLWITTRIARLLQDYYCTEQKYLPFLVFLLKLEWMRHAG